MTHKAHHAYCTIGRMTDPLQTGLATGSETISHTRFDLYIYDPVRTVEP
jgi:hypothetical protein